MLYTLDICNYIHQLLLNKVGEKKKITTHNVGFFLKSIWSTYQLKNSGFTAGSNHEAGLRGCNYPL